MGKASMLFSITFMSTQTVALYGCLSNLISRREDVPGDIGLGMGAGLGLLSVYKWCSEAQNIEKCVSIIYFIYRCRETVKVTSQRYSSLS
jgi:hypothetical protein